MTANRIIQHIFQEPDINQVDEAALEQLVTAYPYFTAARLLLARKQYAQQRNLLAPAIKKAQLYSNNLPYFYRFVTTEEVIAPPVPVEEVENIQEPVAAEIQAEIPPVQAENTQEQVAAEIQAEIPPVQVENIQEPVVAEVQAEITPVQAENTQEQVAAEIQAEIPPVQVENIQEPVATEVQAEITPVQAQNIQEPVVAEIQAETTPVQAENTQEQVTTEETQTIQAEQAQETPVNGVSRATGLEDEDPIKIFPMDVADARETTLIFQPLFTDDYFAYKRLKNPENAEELNEKGMSEMKSFTSWLRDMKHSFAEKTSKDWYHQQLHRSYEDIDPEVSETVEKMAMSSITLNNDIVSETLAEIWARQHQYQTAIHIYEKLSLLNPDKSAYFAQKIKELKLLTEKN